MTTLHASSAAATATYYTKYLTAAPGEMPGVWLGCQATWLGLTGNVSADQLESLLSGRDPYVGTPLGRELLDRYTADGRQVRAVSGVRRDVLGTQVGVGALGAHRGSTVRRVA